ncbi:MAG: hypothetical protein HUK09_01260 [Bacteroidaceae bacterium]|mgnify:CR=1 FL=1|nr:hypothetical protein [Bacteroidaceae bacterium]
MKHYQKPCIQIIEMQIERLIATSKVDYSEDPRTINETSPINYTSEKSETDNNFWEE